MTTCFSNLLRGINRPEKDVLNILLLNSDERFQYMLAKTGHNFYFPSTQQSPPWNINIREIPNNCFLLSGNNLQEQLGDTVFDLVLCQERARDYSFLANLAIKFSSPIMSINNFLPLQEWNQFFVQSLADQIYNSQIFCSKHVCNSHGIEEGDCKIIPKCVDQELFDGWVGGDGKVLTVVDFYPGRKSTGFDMWQELSKQHKMNPTGFSPGLSDPPKCIDDLISSYKNCSVFLNTSSWLSCPVQLLEAMSVGCPIVTTKNTDIQDLIVNGENGFISNNVGEISSYISLLTKDKDLAKKLGDNARKTIVENFNKNIFIDRWNSVFYETIDKPCSLITEAVC